MARSFSNLYREQFIQEMSSQQFDLLVIGGGITGCGIALDAALRGMKVALIEKNDFASGTSSRSTKLIHGGLRYLKQMEFKLVRDVGSERAVVHRNARHVVIPEKMLLPIVEGGSLGKLPTSVGLLVYDLLAGVKAEERRKMLDRHETYKAEPLLNTSGLLGGGLYFEYRTDDSRLVIELAKSAFANGALLLNYAESQKFVYDSAGKITAAIVKDHNTGNEFEIRAKVIVNACGPWVDLLRKEDNSLKGKRLQLTKGVHLVFPYERLPLKQAAYFDVGDGRMIFAIPRDNITYVGTTDTVYNETIDNPNCTKADADYLLKAANHMFPEAKLKLADIQSSWAGLRPLIHEDGKSASELSRKDEIMISTSGLISIAGGKLTGYRLMAEKIVDLAEKKLGKKHVPSFTKHYRLSGGEFKSEEDFNYTRQQILKQAEQAGISANIVSQWFYRYGCNTSFILERLPTNSSSSIENLLGAELGYSIENEMTTRLTDFAIRRTSKIFFSRNETINHLPRLADIIAERLYVSTKEKQQLLDEVEKEFAQVVQFSSPVYCPKILQ
ncbi:MAG: glycerol-3-phosphate dehydrogenase/oxidase [Chitinophagales bacterium]